MPSTREMAGWLCAFVQSLAFICKAIIFILGLHLPIETFHFQDLGVPAFDSWMHPNISKESKIF